MPTFGQSARIRGTRSKFVSLAPLAAIGYRMGGPLALRTAAISGGRIVAAAAIRPPASPRDGHRRGTVPRRRSGRVPAAHRTARPEAAGYTTGVLSESVSYGTQHGFTICESTVSHNDADPRLLRDRSRSRPDHFGDEGIRQGSSDVCRRASLVFDALVRTAYRLVSKRCFPWTKGAA
jgi:pimeloyl-ACP methyl ester carboxylesterase